MRNYILVASGAVIGVTLRYGCMLVMSEQLVLLFVNIVGSFTMGILTAYFEHRAHAELQLLLTTGLLGSFTTFSAFSAEWLDYMMHSPLVAMGYALVMTFSCIGASFVGYVIMKRGERA